MQTALAAALADPAYAAIYNDTLAMVDEAGARADAGLAAAESAEAGAQSALDDTLDRAAQLYPSGEKVFRDEDGNVVTEGGRVLSPEEADSIVWPDDAPSYEEYLARTKTLNDAQARADAWRRYQDLVGEARDRMNDPDNPLTPEELEQIQSEIETALEKTQQLKPDAEFDHKASATSSVALPPLSQ